MTPASTLSPPSPLSDAHDAAAFDSGEPDLDEWLRKRARPNQLSGASRTYVAAAGTKVVGYYCLSSGAIALIETPGKIRRNMPDPIPVTVLGRLAVDRANQGIGLGRALLRDAILRSMQASEIIGIRALLVHAISDVARRFYLASGFQSSPLKPSTMLLLLRDAARGSAAN